MARMSKRTYELQVAVAMSLYMVLIVLVWPLSRQDGAVWLKTLYALIPVVPVVYVIGLMAQRIVRSDEFEQRMHLIGLGVASAVVSIMTLIAAFLALAKLFTLEWAAIALMWVFPLMMITYSAARGYATRRYGGDGCDEGVTGWPAYARFVFIGVTLALLAAYAYYVRRSEELTSLVLGMACGIVVVGGFLWIRKWMRSRNP